ncbi:unnamed protein product, partial [Musa hybrid cultivar]
RVPRSPLAPPLSPLFGETPIFTAAAVDPAPGALRLVVVAIAPAKGAIAEIFDQVIEKKFSDSHINFRFSNCDCFSYHQRYYLF